MNNRDKWKIMVMFFFGVGGGGGGAGGVNEVYSGQSESGELKIIEIGHLH